MVITQAGLGLRVAELLALRVQDVDFLRRTVRVEFQTTPDGKYRVSPKTPRSRRALPLPEVVGKAPAATSLSFRRPRTAHSSPRPTETCTGTSITARGSLLHL